MTDTVLTPAEADRVFAIQAAILAAARDSEAAHRAATARIGELTEQNRALQNRVDELQVQLGNVVDPGAIGTALDSLAGAVAASNAAVAPAPAPAEDRHLDAASAAPQPGSGASSALAAAARAISGQG